MITKFTLVENVQVMQIALDAVDLHNHSVFGYTRKAVDDAQIRFMSHEIVTLLDALNAYEPVHGYTYDYVFKLARVMLINSQSYNKSGFYAYL